jgi:hypothetical protein
VQKSTPTFRPATHAAFSVTSETFFPLRGRKPWLARLVRADFSDRTAARRRIDADLLSAGHGERTAPGTCEAGIYAGYAVTKRARARSAGRTRMGNMIVADVLRRMLKGAGRETREAA